MTFLRNSEKCHLTKTLFPFATTDTYQNQRKVLKLRYLFKINVAEVCQYSIRVFEGNIVKFILYSKPAYHYV